MTGRILVASVFALVTLLPGARAQAAVPAAKPAVMALPKPDLQGHMTLEQALAARRSVRDYTPGPLTLAEVSQLLWAAHGITGPNGKRTTPSARATYPLTIHLAASQVTGLEPGFYRYLPPEHALERLVPGDPRPVMERAARGQAAVKAAPAVFLIAGDLAKMGKQYGERARPWTAMEAGFAAQNVYLEATALGLGTVIVGGFEDGEALRSLGLAPGATQVLMPVGRRR